MIFVNDTWHNVPLTEAGIVESDDHRFIPLKRLATGGIDPKPFGAHYYVGIAPMHVLSIVLAHRPIRSGIDWIIRNPEARMLRKAVCGRRIKFNSRFGDDVRGIGGLWLPVSQRCAIDSWQQVRLVRNVHVGIADEPGVPTAYLITN